MAVYTQKINDLWTIIFYPDPASLYAFFQPVFIGYRAEKKEISTRLYLNFGKVSISGYLAENYYR